jgi:hypothetical protein
VLVLRWHLDAARVSAAVAVAGLVAGWALAQNPLLLPGLTVRQAAAPDNVQTLLVISILAGGLILFPSLALLFRLVLRGALIALRNRGGTANCPTRACPIWGHKRPQIASDQATAGTAWGRGPQGRAI